MGKKQTDQNGTAERVTDKGAMAPVSPSQLRSDATLLH